jgi:uncharacterized protein (AIM24 family)
MERPKILLTASPAETFAGYSYFLDGELIPMLTVDLLPDQSIFFEHHILLWKSPGINIRVRSLKGAMKRMISGMQIFVTEALGPGQIAFSRDGPGCIRRTFETRAGDSCT